MFKKPKIKRSNPKVISTLKKRLKKSGSVDVGIISAESHEDSTLTVAEVGFYNEFGTNRIPERSFLRSTVINQRAKVKEFNAKMVKAIIAGKHDLRSGLGLLGEIFSDEVKKTIVNLRDPKNSDATIARKRTSNPLIETEQLKRSITYEVNL